MSEPDAVDTEGTEDPELRPYSDSNERAGEMAEQVLASQNC